MEVRVGRVSKIRTALLVILALVATVISGSSAQATDTFRKEIVGGTKAFAFPHRNGALSVGSCAPEGTRLQTWQLGNLISDIMPPHVLCDDMANAVADPDSNFVYVPARDGDLPTSKIVSVLAISEGEVKWSADVPCLIRLGSVSMGADRTLYLNGDPCFGLGIYGISTVTRAVKFRVGVDNAVSEIKAFNTGFVVRAQSSFSREFVYYSLDGQQTGTYIAPQTEGVNWNVSSWAVAPDGMLYVAMDPGGDSRCDENWTELAIVGRRANGSEFGSLAAPNCIVPPETLSGLIKVRPGGGLVTLMTPNQLPGFPRLPSTLALIQETGVAHYVALTNDRYLGGVEVDTNGNLLVVRSLESFPNPCGCQVEATIFDDTGATVETAVTSGYAANVDKRLFTLVGSHADFIAGALSLVVEEDSKLYAQIVPMSHLGDEFISHEVLDPAHRLPRKTVLSFGDSIAAGNGTGGSGGYPNNASSYPARLGELLDWQVYNYAKTGACAGSFHGGADGTPSSCQTSILSDQITHVPDAVHPDLITITIGGNDIQFAECLKFEIGFGGENVCSGSAFTQHLQALRKNLREVSKVLRQRYAGVPIVITNYFDPFPSPGQSCNIMPGLYVYINAVVNNNPAKIFKDVVLLRFDAQAKKFADKVFTQAQRVVERLNTALNEVAAAKGLTVVPLDFSGHDLCTDYPESGSTAWVFGPLVDVFFSGYSSIDHFVVEYKFIPTHRCTPTPDCDTEKVNIPARTWDIAGYHLTFTAVLRSNALPHLTDDGSLEVAQRIEGVVQR